MNSRAIQKQPRIYVVPLEYIETRYNAEWTTHIPEMLCKYADYKKLDHGCVTVKCAEDIANLKNLNHEVTTVIVEGDLSTLDKAATSGSFTNFSSTHYWKSSQAMMLSNIVACGEVQDGDVFYFTEAWNPVIIQLRYMLDMLDIKATIHAQWHAGFHDKWDQLFQRMKNKDTNWITNFERSLFHAIDQNYFTTHFYRDMFFSRALGIESVEAASKVLHKTVRAGYPLSYVDTNGVKLSAKNLKRNMVIFPHRNAPEKQPEVFEAVKEYVHVKLNRPDIIFVNCQLQNNGKPTKDDYYNYLSQAKVSVSFALQETYGIAQVEAVFADVIPLSPNRLSYAEMYIPLFLLSDTGGGKMTIEFANTIVNAIDNYAEIRATALVEQKRRLRTTYIGDTEICKNLFGI